MAVRAAISDAGGGDLGAARRVIQAACALWRSGGPTAVTFGAVANAAGISKSLVSHHFASREQMLDQTANALGFDFERALAQFATQLAAADDLASPVDALTMLVEFLALSSPPIGVELLEIAALGLGSASYRELFLRLLKAVERVAPDVERPSSPLMRAFILGELLNYGPRHGGIPGLAGLRQRLGWMLGGRDSAEARWIDDLTVILRNHKPAALSSPASPLLHGHPQATRGGVAKRAAIVAATRDMLAESDAAAITHRGIAERAGLPLAATTYHFASKLQIFEAVYEQVIAAALDEVRRLTEPRDGQPRVDFEVIIAEMLDFYAGSGRRNTLAQFHLALLACRTDELATFATRAHGAEIDLLRALGAESGTGLSRNLAQATLSLISGVILLRLLDSE